MAELKSNRRVERGDYHTLGAQASTAGAQISRFSPRMPSVSSSACSAPMAVMSSSASPCRNTRTRSGTATCRTSGQARFTAIGSTVPTSPRRGHRFNPNKLLIDPYARAIGGLKWSGEPCYGYDVGDEAKDLSFNEEDSAPFMPKCQVVDAPMTGREHGRRAFLGIGRSSTKPMCAASPCCIRPFRRSCAAPSRASATRPLSTT